MQVLKCKMCGGDIEVIENQTYGTCDSCGSIVTLPKISDERHANLFNRANYFRQNNHFDKAVAAFEKILEEDNLNAEAHWGIVLSRFGIEYVEDPKSHERIPTCNRMQNVSIISDPDYLMAIEHAPDGYSRSLYEEEGKRIAQLQKKIFAISQQEEPYDVFICYRETGENGSRTKESVLAQEIYYELTEMKKRTFFARITLESKLGSEYEPYIFAALGSAQVMLVIGTCPDNFNSVWVKNEWSRFIELLKKDRRRQIIPCYRDMDPYDLPEELSVYQSQDMSKLGFMQDLLRGVQKILDSTISGTQQALSENDKASDDTTIPTFESLTRRGELFLEDKEFSKADQYFERALDINPEFAPAYIGKLCVSLEYQYESDLAHTNILLDKDKYFNKAVRFADARMRQRLLKYQEQTFEAAREQERLQQLKRQQELEKQKKLEQLKRQQELEKQEKLEQGRKERLEKQLRQQGAKVEAAAQAQLIYRTDAAFDIPVKNDAMRRMKRLVLGELKNELLKLDNRPEILDYITRCTNEITKLERCL